MWSPRRGRWYLVGHDRDRDATRTFRLSRIGAEVTPIGPAGAVASPTDVDLRDIVAKVVGEPPTGVRAQVWVADGQATALRRAGTSLSARQLNGRDGDVIDLDIGSTGRLAREIAGYGADAVVLEPESLRDDVVGLLRAHSRGGPMTPVSTRLVRLLNMVPYFQANPRITRAEAAADLGVSVKQLGDDLDQLWLCGLPGYGPGDLIDFEFTGDTIEVTFSAGMDTPLRLTSPEATGLLVALRALVDIPGMVDPEAARSAIAKIESAAGAAGHGHEVTAVDEPAAAESASAAAVRAAVRDNRALSIDYYAASHDTLATRIVDPIRIVLVGDHSYLEAWSREAEGVRLFRFDRIVDAAVLDEPSAPPEPALAGAAGHLAVRRRPGAAVGDVAAVAAGLVDVRLLPDAPAAGAARRLLRGGDDVCLRRLDGPSSAGTGLRGARAGAGLAGGAGGR